MREFLPQVRLLGHAAAAVTHGGNNSVTEAMTAGVPLVVLPFSTDQFAGAAALERFGGAVALAPNDGDDGRARAPRSSACSTRRCARCSRRSRPTCVRRPGALRAFGPSPAPITS